jgi:hypothetical protein
LLAHIGALITANPKIADMIRSAADAGLIDEALLLQRLDRQLQDAVAAFMAKLGGVGGIRAEEFIDSKLETPRCRHSRRTDPSANCVYLIRRS